MTPTSPISSFPVTNLFYKLKNLIGNAVTNLGVLVLFLVTIFGLTLITNINTYAQDAGEVSVIGSIGFKECNFVTGAGTKTAAPIADPDAQFQKCVGSVLQFFFALALFIIAVRIGMEAFANINPVEAGKAISNTITLVSDVTIGLLLIGSPGIFLSFFNPTTLSLAGIVNLQRLSGNKPPADAVIGADGKVIPGKTVGDAGVIITAPLKYEDITPEQAAELLKNPEEFEKKYKLALTSIKEDFLTDLRNGKVDWKNPTKKDIDLMKFLKAQNGNNPNEIIDAVSPGGKLGSTPYHQNLLLGARVLSFAPFTLKETDKFQDISGGDKRRDYLVTCPSTSGSAIEVFNEMCGKTVGLKISRCKDRSYTKSPDIPTNSKLNDDCLIDSIIRDTGNIK